TAALKIAADGMGERKSRNAEIMADSAHVILTKNSREFTGNFCLDELLLRQHGVTDFGQYNNTPGTKLEDLTLDFFLHSKQLEDLYALRKQQGAEH
ncbi:hypothetical protein EC988_004751, partial [Linderina pennispora]